MTFNNVAIIPARGGSKRIPKKNIRDFIGRPIISYSIEAAINSHLFNKIIVSTDSKEIAKIANDYGAETPFMRPIEFADDFTGTHDVIGHAIKWLENNNIKIDYACCIYPTAPLIDPKDLIKGFNLVCSGKWESIIAATDYSYPIFRSFKKLSNGGLEMIFPENYLTRSQDLPKVYHDAGMFYWAKSSVWKNPSHEFNHQNSIVEIPNYRANDIDTLEDWKKAELLYKLLNNR